MQPNYLFLLFCCVIERKGLPLSLIVKSIIFAMQPLAERLRPQTLDDYIGQKHLVGEGAVIRRMIEQKRISSFILWGPPGVGKTTLANIIAKTLDVPFFTLSAVTSGVKDVREVIEKAKASSFFGNVRGGVSAILFIDEIHRFSKSQQDSLLGAVEQGTVTLTGLYVSPDETVIRKGRIAGPKEEAERMGQTLARQLKEGE